MNRTVHPANPIVSAISLIAILLLWSGLVFGQGGWRHVGDPTPEPAPVQVQPGTAPGPEQDPEPIDRSDAYGQPQRPGSGLTQQPAPPLAPQPYGLSSRLTLKAGTFVTVRINEMLSSDHNQPGNVFSGVLVQPVVVDGVVVAQHGQTVYGRVAQAQKATASEPSRLGLELTGLTLVDGTQTSIRSQLVARQGPTAPAGQQAGTVAATTGIGAMIGAAADWGYGAAIGAGAGAAAGIIGVLLTRHHPTILYPETALTFSIQSPVTISTTAAPQAFRYVGPEEYDRPVQVQAGPGPAPCYGCAPGPRPYYYSPYYYGYPYWGPGFAFVWGPRYYGGFYRGYYRRWR